MIIEDTTQDQDKSCGICQIQTARYTCPRCNLHYCSLTCYRGDEHNACSEGFYKEQLVTELKNTHSSQHERDRMLSFLQKIEQDAVDDDYNDNETSNDEDHDASSIADLATRLADMNLDTASFDTIWNCLTDKERHDFERIIHNDSEERSVLLKQLDIYHPWWNTQKRQRIIIEDEDHETIMTENKRAVDWPCPLQNLPALEMVCKCIPDDTLLFNVIATLYGYVFLNRYLNGDLNEDIIESASILMDIIPLLTTKQNTTFTCINEAINYARHALTMSSTYRQTEDALTIIMDDLHSLLSKSYEAIQAALGDMYRILDTVSHKSNDTSQSVNSKFRQKAFLASKKLHFYAIYVNWLQMKDRKNVLLIRNTNNITMNHSDSLVESK